MRADRAKQVPEIGVELHDLAPDEVAAQVRERIGGLARYTQHPIIWATVWFSVPTGRARAKGAIVAHAVLQVGGTQLLAFAAGASVGDATERVRTALRGQLVALTRQRRRRASRTAPELPTQATGTPERGRSRHLTG
ncbi:hypothetical protein GCM10010174_25030 [Kutzneria viridogrisea]|uniref:Uncharacterized protein n=2 Tax=Kutzneria TaxID=43356 RepID=W5W544_9PSEU|nr:hypothetical protein [Kutzneria albida]AHH95890.1 hypothetical protein KALB_2522 [Kutzneria albida DSM 43870]MBA8928910.1 hypothetical protein [Kutzneria viridogrisea]